MGARGLGVKVFELEWGRDGGWWACSRNLSLNLPMVCLQNVSFATLYALGEEGGHSRLDLGYVILGIVRI